MGIFKDLGFGKRNGALVAPNSSKFNGMSYSEIQTDLATRLGTDISISADVDGVATVPYSAFTGTVDTSGIVDIFNDGSCKALYQFEGNANDTSGVYNGTATDVTYDAGKFGQAAAVFNGSTSAIQTMNYVSGDVTFSMWIKFSAVANGTYRQIYGRIRTDGNTNIVDRFNIAYGNTGGRHYICLINEYLLATNIEVDSWDPGLDTWNHYCVTLTATTATAYLNGVLSGSSTSSNWNTGARYLSQYPMKFGPSYNTSSTMLPYSGSIDQVRIFNRALTAAEVVRLYTETRKSSQLLQAAGQSDWYRYQLTANNLPATANVYVNGSPQDNPQVTGSIYQKTIYSNQPVASDRFGASVAIGSNFFLVGSLLDDDKATNAGKVEMFDTSGNYIKTIYGNQPAANDCFGVSVAIGTSFFLVGSYSDDDKATDAGKVEMFDLNGNYIKTIYGNQPAANDAFGLSVAIGSSFFLVGSYSDDDKATDAGKVEMFDLSGNYIKTIYSNQPAAGDGFGVSVAIGTSFFLVGSYSDDDKATDAGKVEMFDLSGNYIKTIYSNQPAAGDYFGTSVAIGASFFLVGSYFDDDKGVSAGKVEMFDLSGNYIKTIYSNQPAASDLFGISVAIGSSFFLVGSYIDDDKATDAGKVEMFKTITSFPVQAISATRELDISTTDVLDSVQLSLWTGTIL